MLLGAIINVAVAWGLSLLIDPFTIPGRTGAASVQEWNRTAGRVSDGIFRFGGEASRAGAMRLFAGSRIAGEFDESFNEDPRDILPRWWKHDGWSAPKGPMRAAAEARGWPMLTLWHGVEYADHVGGRGRMRSPGGIELPMPVWRDPMPFSSYDQPRTLPVRLIWPGFVLNTVFYATVLWTLFVGPFVLRRWRRIRRGLCPKCAYDLRGSVGATACPECGVSSSPQRSRSGQPGAQ